MTALDVAAPPIAVTPPAVPTRRIPNGTPLAPITRAATARLQDFHEHPAQMRSVYGVTELATLALQVWQRGGLDEYNPIVAAPRPDGGYFIVSGHRRYRALLLAHAFDTFQSNSASGIAPDEVITPDHLQAFLTRLLDACQQDLEQVMAVLGGKYGSVEVAFALFEGDAKAEILALQRANYGQETPDALGVGYSFQAALKTGIPVEEIARNVGQSVAYVQNHLALTQVPVEIAGKVADGTFPMGVALAVAEVKVEAKRNGLAAFILTQAPNLITAKKVKEVVTVLNGWDGFVLPLDFANQSRRNLARCLLALWQKVVTATPIQSWLAVCRLLYSGIHHSTPWDDPNAYAFWVQALGGDTYHDTQGIKWQVYIEEFLTEVACTTCPLSTLPPQILSHDLGISLSVLGRPCRVGPHSFSKCGLGFAPQDPFLVAVPEVWEHEVIQRQGSHRVVTSIEDLSLAWHLQAVQEANPEPEQAATTPMSATTAPPPHLAGAEPVSRPTTETSLLSGNEAEPAPAPTAIPEQPGPIQKMRATFADYMGNHTDLKVNHPFATSCHRCKHRLEKSPTKDASVPPCAWAARLRNVEFMTLQPESGQAIPVCRQFAPKDRWRELIPEHATPGGLPRNYLVGQIMRLVQDGQRALHQGQALFEFLTGRPMKADEDHRQWFAEEFKQQVGELSDGQLQTLFIWTLAEWGRAKQSSNFILPTSDTATQFVKAAVRPWQTSS